MSPSDKKVRKPHRKWTRQRTEPGTARRLNRETRGWGRGCRGDRRSPDQFVGTASRAVPETGPDFRETRDSVCGRLGHPRDERTVERTGVGRGALDAAVGGADLAERVPAGRAAVALPVVTVESRQRVGNGAAPTERRSPQWRPASANASEPAVATMASTAATSPASGYHSPVRGDVAPRSDSATPAPVRALPEERPTPSTNQAMARPSTSASAGAGGVTCRVHADRSTRPDMRSARDQFGNEEWRTNGVDSKRTESGRGTR